LGRDAGRKTPGFVIHEDSTMRFHSWVCVLAVEELKKKILDKVTTLCIQYTQEEISCIRI